MAVHRARTEPFKATRADLARALREGLSRPPDLDTREAFAGGAFTSTVWPSRWMSPTTLTVELAGDGNQTAMTVRTASKGYVYGDVFGFYDRFIEDVFNRTHRQLVAQP